MAIEEQAEERIFNSVQTIVTGGARLSLRVSKAVGLAMIRTGCKVVSNSAGKAKDRIKTHMNSGEMSEQRLQKKKNGDLHMLKLDDGTLSEIRKSLHQSGIDYTVEPTGDGEYFLHFAGADEDHIRHAVRRAFRNMGLETEPEDFVAEQQEPTPEPRKPAEKPATEHSQEHHTAPTQPETAGVTRETPARFDWKQIDPEMMEQTANQLAGRHPELSWDTLMGAETKWDERTGKEYAAKVLEIAGNDEQLRAEANEIIRSDYGQEPTPEPETKRRDTVKTDVGNGTPATPDAKDTVVAEPKETAAADLTEDHPKKPIRTRKAFNERFKTKLKAKLSAQKAVKAISPKTRTQSR